MLVWARANPPHNPHQLFSDPLFYFFLWNFLLPQRDTPQCLKIAAPWIWRIQCYRGAVSWCSWDEDGPNSAPSGNLDHASLRTRLPSLLFVSDYTSHPCTSTHKYTCCCCRCWCRWPARDVRARPAIWSTLQTTPRAMLPCRLAWGGTLCAHGSACAA